MDSWQTPAGFVLLLSPGSSAGQSCVGPAVGWPGEAGYGCAVWLVAPFHQSVWEERGIRWVGREDALSRWRAGPFAQGGDWEEHQLVKSSVLQKCHAHPAGLLALVGSVCPSPQPLPSACNVTSSLSQVVSVPLPCSALRDPGCHHHRDFLAGSVGCFYLFHPSCDPSFDPPLGLLTFAWLCWPCLMQWSYSCQAHAHASICSSSVGQGNAAVLASGCQLMSDGGACIRSSWCA